MTTSTNRKTRWAAGAATLVVTLTLGGCFFGGTDDSGSTTSGSSGTSTTGGGVPDTAKSTSGFLAFLRGLVSDETSEPVAIGTFNPDTTEAEEAQNL